jgi:4-diphosphocytidyl-2-C-methyl-D-erythritol kinase
MKYALLLGSDCPFFIANKPCFGTGRGELLEEINIDLSAYKFILVHPGIHISTKEAFGEIKPGDFSEKNMLKEQIKQPVIRWKNTVKNDFEKPVFQKHPAIKEIKDFLYKSGALYSAMSGSGSSVYGIFEHAIPPENLKFPNHYFCQIV